MLDDTIAAIATPLGEGGLAVVRLSGPASFSVVETCFEPARPNSLPPSRAPSHTLQYGYINHDGKRVDEVMLAVMRAPRTFTRQDSVEITCHGGILPAKLILDAVLCGGARLAEPGEFTRRAFLNGRIDLTQAEAVADLIHARTELALRAANEQLSGKLSQRVNRLRDELMECLAHVEAHIDFPDEDIAPATSQELLTRLADGLKLADELLATAAEGQILRRGIRAAIVGPPNAGKSSLLNQLLGRDRAIVSHLPGTTRDTVEETANIRGIPVHFIDTAGLREARDEVEAEGIRRSQAALQSAELVLQVIDASEPPRGEDQQFAGELPSRQQILVRNKTDLPVRNRKVPFERMPVVDVSCLTGKGIEELKDRIKALVWSGEIRANMLEVMINARHQDSLTRARTAMTRAAESLGSSESLELSALELRTAANAVGEIVGKTTTEDLLDRIFSAFCIGK